MNNESLTKFWPLIYATIKEFWGITEPHIEEAALRNDIPVELYFYSELGLEYFSTEDFQKRDPFSNPEQFEKLFAHLFFKGWIEAPMKDGRYQVTEKAREGARQIIQAGDEYLSSFESLIDVNLRKLVILLKQIATANNDASPPPQKWAILKRFRVADNDSPWLAQIREYLMDLFAYRDDSHLSASHPHFGQAGIIWSVLGSVWSGNAVSAGQMTESMAFRGYDVDDYEVAIQAAVQIEWLENAGISGAFRPTPKGRELREQAEELTNEYFFRPWSVMKPYELEELHNLLTKLRDQLHELKKTR